MATRKKSSRRAPARQPSVRTKAKAPRKYVYSFDEIRIAERAAGSADNLRGLLGGKGAHLAEMKRLGLPVPPGFVVTTEACNAFLAAGDRFPRGMWDEVLSEIGICRFAGGEWLEGWYFADELGLLLQLDALHVLEKLGCQPA